MGADFIIVSGLPRSGTSLAMQMLAAGGLPPLTDRVRRADADNPLGYFEWEPIKDIARSPERMREARGRATKVISALLRDLPPERYRVLFVERSVPEIRASQSRMLERLGKADADEPPEVVERALTSHLAAIHTWLDAQPNFAVLRLRFADLVEDPAAAAHRIRAFVASDLDAGAMAAAVDPALYRQRLA